MARARAAGGEAVALGFRPHTGWAAAVALAGPVAAPVVIDRRRIALTAETEVEGRHVYHTAAELPLARAQALIDAALAATGATTRDAITALVTALGRPVVRAGIVAGATRVPASLAQVLASHPLIHAAEGAMYRTAIARACERCAIPTIDLVGNALYERGGELLDLTAGRLRDRIDALGADLGPPWARDQKEAALVAWIALAGR